MTTLATLTRATRSLPSVPGAHWLIRLPLAAMILEQGVGKTPVDPAAAAGWGVPFALYTMSALAEIGGSLALLLGGVVRGPMGDILTRLGGAAIAAVIAGVLTWIYWAPLTDIWYGNQLHLLLLVGGLYFALRGNRV